MEVCSLGERSLQTQETSPTGWRAGGDREDGKGSGNREVLNPGPETPQSSVSKRPKECPKEEGTFTGPHEAIIKGSPGVYAGQMISDLFQEEALQRPCLPNSLILLGKYPHRSSLHAPNPSHPLFSNCCPTLLQ